MAVKDWSTTASSNEGILTGITLDGSVMNVPLLDDAFREMASQIASQLGKMNFQGATMPSAATVSLASATGWYLDISGSTTITSFGTGVPAGQLFILRFTGALTITYNASTLILPTAANIVTVGGDIGMFMSLGAGAWRCLAFTRPNSSFLDSIAVAGPNTPDSSFQVYRSITDGFVILGGGSASSTGSYVELFGETHNTNARDIILGSCDGSGYRYFFDWSANNHYWANNTPTQIMSLSSAGALQIDAGLTATTGAFSSNVTVNGSLHGGSVYADNGYFISGGNAVLAASGTGGTVYLRPNGYNVTTEQVYVNSNGTLVIDPTTTGIQVNQPLGSTSYAIIGYGNVSSGAVRGYCNNTSYYGILGYQTGGVAYSFYGAGQALNSTSWDVSDARAKSNIADCDCTDAYAKVRAIGVKSYSKASVSEVGWLAQEIEKVIPDAVMDAGIPEDDTATREMVGGDTIKVTNDRTMLATLWAAFQHQAELIEGLVAKIDKLEAAGG